MTENFIIKANFIHNNKYDYSLVNYINYSTKVKIICKIHGEWEQTPQAHNKGHGCFKCGRDKLRTSNDDFIKKAKEIHKDKYEYSFVEYKNAGTKIKIICKIHGEFEQAPRSHLVGDGCKQCANFALNKTNEQFINEAILLHKDKYDYSLVNYIGSTDKVIIICKIHREFEQTPANHLSGSGCRKCIFDKQTKTNEQFINEAMLVHGNKYDYLYNYEGARKNIIILCKIHGEFKQTAGRHLSGHGCKKCGIDFLTKTIEKFIKEANKIHGDKYDYSLVKYINNKTNLKIICKIHGEFEQYPNTHLSQKSGCPYCINKTEGKIKEFLLQNNIIFESQYTVNNKKFDFLISNKYILEIDGAQHFPNIKKQNPKIKTNRIDILNNDIIKMKSIIKTYSIVRLFQENIWDDNYDWKTLLLNLNDLESETLYIRLDEEKIYHYHISNFNVLYLSD